MVGLSFLRASTSRSIDHTFTRIPISLTYDEVTRRSPSQSGLRRRGCGGTAGMDERRNRAVGAATYIALHGHAIQCAIDPGGDIVAVQGHMVLIEPRKFRLMRAFSRSRQHGYDENR